MKESESEESESTLQGKLPFCRELQNHSIAEILEVFSSSALIFLITKLKSPEIK